MHATFLLTGNAAPSKGEDDKMDVDENPTETVAIRKIMLVGEDELESEGFIPLGDSHLKDVRRKESIHSTTLYARIQSFTNSY